MRKYILSLLCLFLVLGFFLHGSPSAQQHTTAVPLPASQAQNDSCDLLILTTSYYTDMLTTLQDHKNTKGITTKIIDIQDIYDGTITPAQGRNPAEQIKYFLKYAYDTWNTSYVLFFGSTRMIPTQYANIYLFGDEPMYNYTSELYYADLTTANGSFSTWDADNDSRYLEWYNLSAAEDNTQDLTPELAIGRISFSSPLQAQLIINKIIRYETSTAPAPWFTTIVVAGGDTFLEFEGNEGEIMTQNALNVMTDFTPKTLWASNGKLDRFGLCLVRALNQGCGFVYLAGHGSSNLWATFDENGRTIGYFTSLHTLALLNPNKLPVCILSGCHVNKIEKGTCLGITLTQRSIGGAIAALGPTNIGYLGFEYNGGGLDFMELQFFKEYHNGTRILGDIWKACLTRSLEAYPINWSQPAGANCAIDAKMVSEWIIIGDPSLQIKTLSS